MAPTIGTGSKLQSSKVDQSMRVDYVTNSTSAYTANAATVTYDHCSTTARAWTEVIGVVPRTWPMTRLMVQRPTMMNSERMTPYHTVEMSMYVPLVTSQPNWYMRKIRIAAVRTMNARAR